MRVVILGTSSPSAVTRPAHAGTGVVVSVGESHLLLDCGPGVTRRLASAGLDLRDVEHVLLTHHHWDHLMDLPVFVMARWERSIVGSSAGDPLAPVCKVFGPPETERIVGLLFGEDGVLGDDIRTRVSADMGLPIYSGLGADVSGPPPLPQARDAEPGLVLETAAFRVVAAEAQHTQPYLSSLAYRVEDLERGGGVVVFAGDSAPCRSVIELARGADLLLHEGAMSEERRQRSALENVHSSDSTVGAIAAQAGVRKLVIVHHELTLADHSTRAALITRVRQDFTGDVEVATELTEFWI